MKSIKYNVKFSGSLMTISRDWALISQKKPYRDCMLQNIHNMSHYAWYIFQKYSTTWVNDQKYVCINIKIPKVGGRSLKKYLRLVYVAVEIDANFGLKNFKLINSSRIYVNKLSKLPKICPCEFWNFTLWKLQFYSISTEFKLKPTHKVHNLLFWKILNPRIILHTILLTYLCIAINYAFYIPKRIFHKTNSNITGGIKGLKSKNSAENNKLNEK